MSGAALPRPDRETGIAGADKLELKLWLRLLTCTHLIETELRAQLRAAFDTTLPRFDVLAQLDRAPEGLTMSALSARLMVSNGNVTGLVAGLVRDGFVRRMPHPEDGRSQRIVLTPAGKRAFDAMTPAHEAWIDRMMNGLDRHEMSQLLELLGKLKRSLQHARGMP